MSRNLNLRPVPIKSARLEMDGDLKKIYVIYEDGEEELGGTFEGELNRVCGNNSYRDFYQQLFFHNWRFS